MPLSHTTRWRTPVVDDDTAFAALKAGLDLVPSGDKVLWNSGTWYLMGILHEAHANFVVLAEFYGIDPPTANLELLSRFFVKYPEYKDRVFLSVKVLDDVILHVVLIINFSCFRVAPLACNP
jgi:pyridoxine 4-dehydrogenase